MKERIQKALASIGVDSRRHIEDMVRDGRVSVNGTVVRRLPVMVDIDEDTVEIDRVVVSSPSKAQRRRNRERGPAYILMYKPKGVYTTNVAQGEQQRAIDLLPPGFDTRVYSVGRLDADCEGLLLLTNDGELTNQLTHPRYGVPKTYRCYCDGLIPAESIQRLIQGVWLADPEKGGFKASASKVELVKRLREKTVLDITLTEGRNHQVRRMLAHLGHKVRSLARIKMGPLTLKGLKPGDSRLLTAGELHALRDAVEKATRRNERKRQAKRDAPKPPSQHRPAAPRVKAHRRVPNESAQRTPAAAHPLGVRRGGVDDDDSLPGE